MKIQDIFPYDAAVLRCKIFIYNTPVILGQRFS